MPLLGHEAGIEQDAEVRETAGRLIWKCPASALTERGCLVAPTETDLGRSAKTSNGFLFVRGD